MHLGERRKILNHATIPNMDRVHASSEEEYLLAPDHHTGEIALARRQAANQHPASCEAEEEALCWRAGKRPLTRRQATNLLGGV